MRIVWDTVSLDIPKLNDDLSAINSLLYLLHSANDSELGSDSLFIILTHVLTQDRKKADGTDCCKWSKRYHVMDAKGLEMLGNMPTRDRIKVLAAGGDAAERNFFRRGR